MTKDPVHLTDRAWAVLVQKMGEAYAVKLGLKSGGCAGMEYEMTHITQDAISNYDLVLEGPDGGRLVIDAKAQMYIFGMEIDFETSLLESGFRFKNPNVVESCGCGESVSFKTPNA